MTLTVDIISGLPINMTVRMRSWSHCSGLTSLKTKTLAISKRSLTWLLDQDWTGSLRKPRSTARQDCKLSFMLANDLSGIESRAFRFLSSTIRSHCLVLRPRRVFSIRGKLHFRIAGGAVVALPFQFFKVFTAPRILER